MLEQLTSDQIRKGMIVVCFEQPASIRVGRVYSEVTRYPLRQALKKGIFAEFDLLYADQHARAGDLIWEKYFYGNTEVPRTPGVFKWPGLMKVSFKLAESSLSSHPGWLTHIEIRAPLAQQS